MAKKDILNDEQVEQEIARLLESADVKLAKKQNKDTDKLFNVIERLAN